MSQDLSSSQGHIGPLSKAPLSIQSCPTTTSQESPSLNNKEQIGSSSSAGCETPQATSEAQDHDPKLQGCGGHETKLVPGEGDTERLQACLKHPNISDNARPASGTNSRGVENVTTKTTAASGKPLAKPSSLQSQPAPAAFPRQDDLMLHGILETRNTAVSSSKSDASAPSRKSLPGTSTLQGQSAKENNVGLPRPILNNTQKTSLLSNASNPFRFPNRLLSAASKKAHQQKKPSELSSSSGTVAPRSKQASGSTIASVYFKGNGSYYTPFHSASPGVSKHPSKRAMDGTASTESKLRPSSEKDRLESSSQLSQPVPGVPALTSKDPRQKSELTHSEISESASSLNQLHKKPKDPNPSENTQETLRDDRDSEDSELSDIESVDPRSFSSNTTASALGQLHGLVIVDSDDDNDDDDNNNDDDRVTYDAEKDDGGRENDAFADHPANSVSATNTSCPYTKHTKDSALDDTPYKVRKGNASVNATEVSDDAG